MTEHRVLINVLFRRDHLDEMTENRSLILQFHGEILNFIRALMFKCFIIEKQPPQVCISIQFKV